MKKLTLLFIAIFLATPSLAEIGKSSTRLSVKWLAVNEANKDLMSKCGGPVSNREIKTSFSNETGYVAEVIGDCASSASEVFLYWGYDFQRGDPNVEFRSKEWQRKVKTETAVQVCSNAGKKVAALKILSEGNTSTGRTDEYVPIFGSGNLEYQWLAWMLTCS